MNIESFINKYIPKKYKVSIENESILFEVKPADIVKICTGIFNKDGASLVTITAENTKSDLKNSFKVYYVFSIASEKWFLIPYLRLDNTLSFPTLSNAIYESSFYEKEIATLFGLKPNGLKNYQSTVLHSNWPKDLFPMRKDYKWNFRPKIPRKEDGLEYKFQIIEGDGIYEIPVGPVHAGVIEPGHFRFSVAGEEVVNLEPQLGYVHKGSEKLFEVLPMSKKIELSEHISGDSSFSHSLAFCQAVEQLIPDLHVPEQALYTRVLFAELERIANHLGDIGFIMNDTGFAFGGSQFTRLREVIMQTNEDLTGSRFLRGINNIGGINRGISAEKIPDLIEKIKNLAKDFSEIVYISEDVESVINRLKLTGVLHKEVAIVHGVVGVAARASGIAKDVRKDHSYAAYNKIEFETALHKDGDVFSRYRIRVQEVQTSIKIILQILSRISDGPILNEKYDKLNNNSHSVGMVEGWRGSIVYFIITNNRGEISRVSVRDASFLNWQAVPFAVVGNIVPDFPLINKSFNLSYSGNDK